MDSYRFQLTLDQVIARLSSKLLPGSYELPDSIVEKYAERFEGIFYNIIQLRDDLHRESQIIEIERLKKKHNMTEEEVINAFCGFEDFKPLGAEEVDNG